MTATAPILLDALAVSTIAGTLLLVLVLAAVRLRARWSGQLRHDLVAWALAANIGALGILVAVAPAPLGCLLTNRTPPVAEHASGDAQERFTYDAAKKFPDAGATRVARTPTPRMDAPDRDLAVLLVLLWLAGVAAALTRTVRRRVATGRLCREATPLTDPALLAAVAEAGARCGLTERIAVATHPRVTTPSVAGALRPVLLLPPGVADGGAEGLRIVLLHELAHVRRRDGLVALLGEVAAALLWFNPLAHRAVRRMLDLQEMAADSEVLRGGTRPSTYADYLLAAFRAARAGGGALPHGVQSILGECQIEARVRTILDARVAHAPPTRLQSALLRTAALTATAAILLAPGWMGSALFAQGTTPASASEAAPIDRNRVTAESIDRIVRPVVINAMAARYVAGAAVAVVHEGRLVYARGFGRREVFREEPVEVERTIWRIGSITKVLTAIAVLRLVDEGKVDLDADVNTYLRDVKVPATYAEPVRVRHLLTHTAGFDQIGLGRHAPDAASVRPMGEFLGENLVRIRPPGVSTTYDTYAITLAGHLVEQVSGLSFEEYLRRHILEPLEMHRAGITVPPALRPDVATGYSFAGQWEAAPWEYMNTAPASSMNATAPEMANLAIMLLEGGRFNEHEILSERSARAMMTQQFTNHPDQPGFGYTLFEDRSRGVRAFSHGGSMEGFGAFLYLVPGHRLGIYVASNQESSSIADPVVRALVDSLFPGHGPPVAMRPRLPRPGPTARFVGRYANSMYHHGDPTKGWRIAPFEIRADSARRLVFYGKPAYAVGPLTFQRDDGVLLSFREDERGRIKDLVVNQVVYERLP